MRNPLFLSIAIAIAACVGSACTADNLDHDTGILDDTGYVEVVDDPILDVYLTDSVLTVSADPGTMLELVGFASTDPYFVWTVCDITVEATNSYLVESVDDRRFCVSARGNGADWHGAGCIE